MCAKVTGVYIFIVSEVSRPASAIMNTQLMVALLISSWVLYGICKSFAVMVKAIPGNLFYGSMIMERCSYLSAAFLGPFSVAVGTASLKVLLIMFRINRWSAI